MCKIDGFVRECFEKLPLYQRLFGRETANMVPTRLTLSQTNAKQQVDVCSGSLRIKKPRREICEEGSRVYRTNGFLPLEPSPRVSIDLVLCRLLEVQILTGWHTYLQRKWKFTEPSNFYNPSNQWPQWILQSEQRGQPLWKGRRNPSLRGADQHQIAKTINVSIQFKAVGFCCLLIISSNEVD